MERYFADQKESEQTCTRNCVAMCTNQTELLTQRDLIEYSRMHKKKILKYYSRIDAEDSSSDFQRAK